MQYNVAQLLKEPTGSSRRYEVDEDLPPLAGTPIRRVRGRVRFLRTDRGVWVQGRLETGMESQCSRCLEPFTLRMVLVLNEEYFPTVDVVTGAFLEVPPEAEGTFIIDERHTLDLTEAVRQRAILAEPMKPLCRPDCRGLCPRCGANRNLSPCTCATEAVDPRWQALRDLLARQMGDQPA